MRLTPKPKFKSLSDTDEKLLAESRKRAAKLRTDVLIDHADGILSGMQRGLDDYRQYQELASIAEIALGLITLEAVVLELKVRSEARAGEF